MLTKDSGRGTALVVDDTRFNRQLLGSLLLKEGYDVVEAENGQDALDKLEDLQADIIFMDVVMPVMDGYETTRKIKATHSDDFIPVIFITGLNDDESLVRCIESGGDDFISKPFRESVLKAKVKAMERIRDLYRERKYLLSYMQRDQEIAEQVFQTAVTNDEKALAAIKHKVNPATTFSGDILLTSYGPTGDLHVLLGDFTGHGLAAAIGALPLSDVFHAMSKKGFAVQDIVVSLNAKLAHALPDGMFMAGCYACIKSDGKSIEIWNGGMNDITIINRETMEVRESFPSNAVPLGIIPELGGMEKPHLVMVKPDDAILLYSDGVVEEENSDGEPFGVSRLLEAVKSSNHIDHVIDEVNQRLDTFCEGTEQADDVSIVVVPVQPYQQRRTALDSEVTRELLQGQWCWSLVLKGAQLGRVEPVPLAIAQIADLIKSDGHAETLFTILTELYVNALDHGILGLDSSIKETELGFIEYFELREKKLAEIQEGMIRFDIKLEDSRRGLGIRMRVQDSGPGFDYQKTIDALEQNSGNSGRGIALVNELASSLSYSGDGNIVEAFYMLS